MRKTVMCLLMLVGMAGASGAEVAPLVSGQKVQVKKLARDIANVRASIVTTGPSTFQAPQNVTKNQKRFQQFTEALNRYPQLDDPLVQAARAEYFKLQEALKVEFTRANEQIKELGDVQARMSLLKQNFEQYPVPKIMKAPFDKKAVAEWLEKASAARTVGEHNLKEANAIAPLAYLPNNPGTPDSGALFDANDLKAMQQNAIMMQKQVQENYQTMSSTTINKLQQKMDQVKSRWQDDPMGDKKWVFLKADQVAQAEELFSSSKALAQSSIYLEQALKQDHSVASKALDLINQAQQKYQDNAKIALNASKLPEAQSEDYQRFEFAEDILEKPRYEFGEYGPIILTTKDIIERESKSSNIDIDKVDVASNGDIKMSGTETTWTYRWQEFKFVTPLKAPDGKWYIWWITAKKYSSGSSITPLGEWVSGEATQGNPILPSNF